MTLIDDKAIVRYLNNTVNKVFKILPLYEEENSTLDSYVESLILELRGFVATYGSVGIVEYISIISTLEGVQEIISEKDNQPTVKREVFKCIETIKRIEEIIVGD